MVYIFHTDILKCRHKIKQHTITVDSQVKKNTDKKMEEQDSANAPIWFSRKIKFKILIFSNY